MPVQIRIGDESFDIEQTPSGWRVNGSEVGVHAGPAGPNTVHLLIDGESRVVTIEHLDGGRFRATVNGRVIDGSVRDARSLLLERYGMSNGAEVVERTIRAPMPGLVVRVLVEPGDAVEAGQGVVVLEAMKMENELRSPSAGTVGAVHARPGTAVGKNELLMEID
jgi:pyruvate carboxylase subunit B